ncbi:toxin-antitoxin system HicB family antitoxin [Streptomyces sp. NPDC051133]|uniref:toxin-antitoxin system HicB family antitoxin n=1 Tax=Streptomyces sp. NPDC051133 TaxID=3155521 RepID=UPI00341F8DBC
MSVTTMTLRIPDELAPSIKAAASEAGLSVNAYVVRAARRAATLDAAHQLAALGLGNDLADEDEGDTL